MSEHYDIRDALYQLGKHFQRAGLTPPVSVTLDSHKDGMAFVCALKNEDRLQFDPRVDRFGTPVEHPDGSVWMEVEVVGIKVRWPANKYARSAGDFIWF